MPLDLIITAALSVGAVFIAYRIGQAKGRALGWCDYHFQQIEADNARRDRAGRFTTTKKKAE